MSDARSNSYVTLRQRKPFKVVVSIITLVAFFVNTFAYDLAWAGGSALSELTSVGSDRATGPGLIRELDPATFRLPDSLGTIKDSWSAGSSKPTIIHIQDAHCNYYAQTKISEIVDYLNKEYGISTINLEGGAREYDLSPFTDIKDKALRLRASDHFVREGLVNGAEYFAVNNPEKAALWGVEDAKLYVENLNIYRNSIRHKEDIDRYVRSLSYILNNLKTKIYSKELFEFDLKYTQYKAGNIEFRDYLSYLILKAKEGSIDIKKMTDIYLLSQALEEESRVDFERANNERDSLIDMLQKKLSKRMLEELVLKSVEFQADKISQKDYYTYLAAKAKIVNVDLKGFPELGKYIVYIAMYDAINKVNVMNELEVLEDGVRAVLCRTDDERKLSGLSKNLALLKNIFGISITRQDYEYYKKNEGSFAVRNYVSFITGKAPPYGITATLDEDIADLDKYREDMIGFFEHSLKRDKAFLKNLKFPKSGKPASLLITGGFHTDNLAGLFRKNGINYVSIMPNFRNEDGYVCNYYKLLSGEKSLDLQAQLPSVLSASLAVPDTMTTDPTIRALTGQAAAMPASEVSDTTAAKPVTVTAKAGAGMSRFEAAVNSNPALQQALGKVIEISVNNAVESKFTLGKNYKPSGVVSGSSGSIRASSSEMGMVHYHPVDNGRDMVWFLLSRGDFIGHPVGEGSLVVAIWGNPVTGELWATEVATEYQDEYLSFVMPGGTDYINTTPEKVAAKLSPGAIRFHKLISNDGGGFIFKEISPIEANNAVESIRASFEDIAKNRCTTIENRAFDNQMRYPHIGVSDVAHSIKIAEMRLQELNGMDRRYAEANIAGLRRALVAKLATAAKPAAPKPDSVSVEPAAPTSFSGEALTSGGMAGILESEVSEFNDRNPDRQFILRTKETSTLGYLWQSLLDIRRLFKSGTEAGLKNGILQSLMLIFQMPVPCAFPIISKDGNLEGAKVFARPKTFIWIPAIIFGAMLTSHISKSWWGPRTILSVYNKIPTLERYLVDGLASSQPGSLLLLGVAIIGMVVVATAFVYFRFRTTSEDAAMHELLHAKQMFELYKAGIEFDALNLATGQMSEAELSLWEKEVALYNQAPKTRADYHDIGNKVRDRFITLAKSKGYLQSGAISSVSQAAKPSAAPAATRGSVGDGVVGAMHHGGMLEVMRSRLLGVFKWLGKRRGGLNDAERERLGWGIAMAAIEKKNREGNDRALVQEAVKNLMAAGLSADQANRLAGMILLVDVDDKNLAGKEGEIGGLIVRHNGVLKILMPRKRFLGLDPNSEAGKKTLGDILHEAIEVELLESGMNVDEAHYQAMRVRDAFMARGPPAAASISKELRDPFRTGRIEAGFRELVGRAMDGLDLSVIDDSGLAVLTGKFFELLDKSGWYESDRLKNIFKSSLTSLLTKDQLDGFRDRFGHLDQADIAIILQRIHTLVSDMAHFGITENMIPHISLADLMSNMPLSNAQYMSLMNEMGLGEGWNEMAADEETSALIAAGRFNEAARNIGRVDNKWPARMKAVCAALGIRNLRKIENAFLVNIIRSLENEHGFVERISEKLNEDGIRSFRLQLLIHLVDGLQWALSMSASMGQGGLKVERVVARGADGIVLSVVDEKGNRIAVKVNIPIPGANTSEFEKALRMVTQAVRVNGVFVKNLGMNAIPVGNGQSAIIEYNEFVDGITLRDLVDRLDIYDVSLANVVAIITQFLLMHVSLEKLGYANRDVRNISNIVVEPTGMARFVDFGNIVKGDREKFAVQNRDMILAVVRIIFGQQMNSLTGWDKEMALSAFTARFGEGQKADGEKIWKALMEAWSDQSSKGIMALGVALHSVIAGTDAGRLAMQIPPDEIVGAMHRPADAAPITSTAPEDNKAQLREYLMNYQNWETRPRESIGEIIKDGPTLLAFIDEVNSGKFEIESNLREEIVKISVGLIESDRGLFREVVMRLDKGPDSGAARVLASIILLGALERDPQLLVTDEEFGHILDVLNNAVWKKRTSKEIALARTGEGCMAMLAGLSLRSPGLITAAIRDRSWAKNSTWVIRIGEAVRKMPSLAEAAAAELTRMDKTGELEPGQIVTLVRNMIMDLRMTTLRPGIEGSIFSALVNELAKSSNSGKVRRAIAEFVADALHEDMFGSDIGRELSPQEQEALITALTIPTDSQDVAGPVAKIIFRSFKKSKLDQSFIIRILDAVSEHAVAGDRGAAIGSCVTEAVRTSPESFFIIREWVKGRDPELTAAVIEGCGRAMPRSVMPGGKDSAVLSDRLAGDRSYKRFVEELSAANDSAEEAKKIDVESFLLNNSRAILLMTLSDSDYMYQIGLNIARSQGPYYMEQFFNDVVVPVSQDIGASGSVAVIFSQTTGREPSLAQKVLEIASACLSDEMDARDILRDVAANVSASKTSLKDAYEQLAVRVLQRLALRLGIKDLEITTDEASKWQIPYLSKLIISRKKVMGLSKAYDPLKEIFDSVIKSAFQGRFDDFITDPDSGYPMGGIVAGHNSYIVSYLASIGVDMKSWDSYAHKEELVLTDKADISEISGMLGETEGNLLELFKIASEGQVNALKNTLGKIGFKVSIDGNKLTIERADAETRDIRQIAESLCNNENNAKLIEKTLGFIISNQRNTPEVKAAAEHLRTSLEALKMTVRSYDERNKARSFARKFTIRRWQRDPRRDIFQGNFTSCCIAMGATSLHPEALPEYLIDKGVQVVEVVDEDNGRTIAQAFVFIGEDDRGKPVVVIDSIQISPEFRGKESNRIKIRDALMGYIRVYGEEAGCSAIYLGDTPYGDVPVDIQGSSKIKNDNKVKKAGGYLWDFERQGFAYYLESMVHEDCRTPRENIIHVSDISPVKRATAAAKESVSIEVVGPEAATGRLAAILDGIAKINMPEASVSREGVLQKDGINIVIKEGDVIVGCLTTNDSDFDLKDPALRLSDGDRAVYIDDIQIRQDLKGTVPLYRLWRVFVDEARKRGVTKIVMHARISNGLSEFLQNRMGASRIMDALGNPLPNKKIGNEEFEPLVIDIGKVGLLKEAAAPQGISLREKIISLIRKAFSPRKPQSPGSDVTLAAGQRLKPLHGTVHRSVLEGLPDELKGFGEKTKAEQELIKEGIKRKNNGRLIIPIKGLMRNTGLLGHIGLGRYYGEPVIYVDARLSEDEVRDVVAHELFEISKWESKRRDMGLSHDQMREWIRSNSNAEGTGEAQVLAEEWHGLAPSVEHIFRRWAAIADDDSRRNWQQLQQGRVERIIEKLQKAMADNIDEYKALFKEKMGFELEELAEVKLSQVLWQDENSAYATHDSINILLDLASILDDDELTWVLGHELSHYQELIQKAKNFEKLDEATKARANETVDFVANGSYGQLTAETVLSEEFIARHLEMMQMSEASKRAEFLGDETGVFIASKAGFDPKKAVTAMDKVFNFMSPNLLERSKTKKYETHPDDPLRMAAVEEAIGKYEVSAIGDVYEDDVVLAAAPPSVRQPDVDGFNIANERFERLAGDVIQNGVIFGVESGFTYGLGMFSNVIKGERLESSGLNLTGPVFVHFHPELSWGLTPSSDDLKIALGKQVCMVIWGTEETGFFAMAVDMRGIKDMKEYEERIGQRNNDMEYMLRQDFVYVYKLEPVGQSVNIGYKPASGANRYNFREVSDEELLAVQQRYEKNQKGITERAYKGFLDRAAMRGEVMWGRSGVRSRIQHLENELGRLKREYAELLVKIEYMRREDYTNPDRQHLLRRKAAIEHEIELYGAELRGCYKAMHRIDSELKKVSYELGTDMVDKGLVAVVYEINAFVDGIVIKNVGAGHGIDAVIDEVDRRMYGFRTFFSPELYQRVLEYELERARKLFAEKTSPLSISSDIRLWLGADLWNEFTLLNNGEPAEIISVTGKFEETLGRMRDKLKDIPDDKFVCVVIHNEYPDRIDHRVVIDRAGHIKERADKLWMGNINLMEYEFQLDLSAYSKLKTIHFHDISLGRMFADKLQGKGLMSKAFGNIVAVLGNSYPGWDISTVALFDIGKHWFEKYFNAIPVSGERLEKVQSYVYVDPPDMDRVMVGKVSQAPAAGEAMKHLGDEDTTTEAKDAQKRIAAGLAGLRAMPQDEDLLKSLPRELRWEIEDLLAKQEVPGVTEVRILHSDDLLGNVPAIHMVDGNTLFIILKNNLSPPVMEEAIYHELREAALIHKDWVIALAARYSVDPARVAHIIASNQQAGWQAGRGMLEDRMSPYHKEELDRIAKMGTAELLKFLQEDRSFHKAVLSEALKRGEGIVIDYDENVHRAILEAISAKFQAGFVRYISPIPMIPMAKIQPVLKVPQFNPMNININALFGGEEEDISPPGPVTKEELIRLMEELVSSQDKERLQRAIGATLRALLEKNRDFLPELVKAIRESDVLRGYVLSKDGFDGVNMEDWEGSRLSSDDPLNFLRDREEFKMFLFIMSMMRLAFNQHILDGKDGNPAQAPLEYAREKGYIFNYRSDGNGSVAICPVAESYRRHILVVKDAGGEETDYEIKIPGDHEDKRVINRTNFDIAKQAWIENGDGCQVVRPAFMFRANGVFGAYGHKIEALDPADPLNFVLFKYKDKNNDRDGRRLARIKLGFEVLKDDYLEAVLKNVNEKRKKAGQAELTLQEFKRDVIIQTMRAGKKLLDMGYKGHCEEGTDFHIENFRLQRDGTVVSVADFGAFEPAPEYKGEGAAGKEKQEEINGLVEPLLAAWKMDFNELYGEAVPEMKGLPLEDSDASYIRTLNAHPPYYPGIANASGMTPSQYKNMFILMNQHFNPNAANLKSQIINMGPAATFDPKIFDDMMKELELKFHDIDQRQLNINPDIIKAVSAKKPGVVSFLRDVLDRIKGALAAIGKWFGMGARKPIYEETVSVVIEGLAGYIDRGGDIRGADKGLLLELLAEIRELAVKGDLRITESQRAIFVEAADLSKDLKDKEMEELLIEIIENAGSWSGSPGKNKIPYAMMAVLGLPTYFSILGPAGLSFGETLFYGLMPLVTVVVGHEFMHYVVAKLTKGIYKTRFGLEGSSPYLAAYFQKAAPDAARKQLAISAIPVLFNIFAAAASLMLMPYAASINPLAEHVMGIFAIGNVITIALSMFGDIPVILKLLFSETYRRQFQEKVDRGELMAPEDMDGVVDIEAEIQDKRRVSHDDIYLMREENKQFVNSITWNLNTGGIVIKFADGSRKELPMDATAGDIEKVIEVSIKAIGDRALEADGLVVKVNKKYPGLISSIQWKTEAGQELYQATRYEIKSKLLNRTFVVSIRGAESELYREIGDFMKDVRGDLKNAIPEQWPGLSEDERDILTYFVYLERNNVPDRPNIQYVENSNIVAAANALSLQASASGKSARASGEIGITRHDLPMREAQSFVDRLAAVDRKVSAQQRVYYGGIAKHDQTRQKGQKSFADILAESPGVVFTANDKATGECIGYVIAGPGLKPGQVNVFYSAVKEKWQGHGKALMIALLTHLRREGYKELTMTIDSRNRQMLEKFPRIAGRYGLALVSENKIRHPEGEVSYFVYDMAGKSEKRPTSADTSEEALISIENLGDALRYYLSALNEKSSADERRLALVDAAGGIHIEIMNGLKGLKKFSSGKLEKISEMLDHAIPNAVDAVYKRIRDGSIKPEEAKIEFRLVYDRKNDIFIARLSDNGVGIEGRVLRGWNNKGNPIYITTAGGDSSLLGRGGIGVQEMLRKAPHVFRLSFVSKNGDTALKFTQDEDGNRAIASAQRDGVGTDLSISFKEKVSTTPIQPDEITRTNLDFRTNKDGEVRIAIDLNEVVKSAQSLMESEYTDPLEAPKVRFIYDIKPGNNANVFVWAKPDFRTPDEKASSDWAKWNMVNIIRGVLANALYFNHGTMVEVRTFIAPDGRPAFSITNTGPPIDIGKVRKVTKRNIAAENPVAKNYGISAEQVDKMSDGEALALIFKPRVTTKSGVSSVMLMGKREPNGMGLGLTKVAEVIKASKGEIGVETGKKETRFTFIFEKPGVQAAETAPKSTTTSAAEYSPSAGEVAVSTVPDRSAAVSSEDTYNKAREIMPQMLRELFNGSPTFDTAPAPDLDAAATTGFDNTIQRMMRKEGHNITARHYKVGETEEVTLQNLIGEISRAETISQFNTAVKEDPTARWVVRTLSPKMREGVLKYIEREMSAANGDISDETMRNAAVKKTMSRVHVIVESIRDSKHLNPVIDLFVDIGMMEMDRYMQKDYTGDPTPEFKNYLSNLLALSVEALPAGKNLEYIVKAILTEGYILIIKAVNWDELSNEWKRAQQALIAA